MKDKFFQEELAGIQLEIEERHAALRYMGISPAKRLTKTLIERFDKCVNWVNDFRDYGYDRREKFMAANRYSKLFLITSGAFELKSPLPKLRRLKGQR
jgi:hypothetical protein